MIVLAVLVFFNTLKADIFNFSDGGMYSGAVGPWAFRTNPAGIVENELRRLLLGGTLRLGTNISRSFSVSLVQPPIDSLAGIISLSADFTDFNVERLSFLYVVAGKAGNASLGAGIGLDKVVENGTENYSVFVDLGMQGKFVEGGYLGYSIALKKLQLWSSKSPEMKVLSLGGGLKLDFEQMVFSFDVTYFNDELWNFAPSAQLNVNPVSLYVSMPFLYKSLTESSISVEFGATVDFGTMDFGFSVLYPFSTLNSSDLLRELGYNWQIDFRVGFNW